jgi:predicted MFS family arabinose efflux permease
MTAGELQSSLALALIFFLRMFGLFLILPVFVLYAETLPDATPTLIGLALGCYGLTQALFQVPFGMASDRIGRKPVIVAGLLIFMLGSVIAGSADSIFIIILGRALQGTGAIAAAIMALAADLTRDTQRSKAMAIIGISIGFAFALALIAGPALNPLIGVPGLFYLSAGLAVFAIITLFVLVPTPDKYHYHAYQEELAGNVLPVLADKKLLRLYISIFILHMILMASFVVIPLILRDLVGIASDHHWQIYLPVLIISALIMVPFLVLGEKYNKTGLFFCGAVFLMILVQFSLFIWHMSVTLITVLLTLFFLAFNYLEATLPALITKAAPQSKKGTALGIYSTSQFIGTFTGGLAGGYLYDHYGLTVVFVFSGIVSIFWLFALLIMQNPLDHKKL